MDDLASHFTSEFDRDPELRYLNSANLSLCPRPVLTALTRYQREFEQNPTLGLARAGGQLWEAQKHLADFLGAEPADLFLRANVTSTLNAFLLGMPLPPESEILVGELEYGAIANICRMRAEREGLSWRILGIPHTPFAFKDLTPQKLLAHLISQLGPKTKLVLLSHVIAGTGLIMPIEDFAKETRARGILLAVDGAYAPGILPVDFKSLKDVDFYGCSLYKWMLGPKGTAFGWVAKRHQAALRPREGGWNTFGAAGPLSHFAEGNRFQQTFLMTGCHDFAPFRAIQDTLEFWQGHGAQNIRDRITHLSQHLDSEVTRRLDWIPLKSSAPELTSPLRTYLWPARLQSQGPTAARAILEKLKIQINMVCLRDQWGVSFSPHIYNTEAEITRAVQDLASL